MTVYVYESALGNRIERDYRIGKQPRRLTIDGVRFDLAIVAPMVSIPRSPYGPQPLPRSIGGIKERAPNGDAVVRNKSDIRNIEAANPGLKFNPDYYHDSRNYNPGR